MGIIETGLLLIIFSYHCILILASSSPLPLHNHKDSPTYSESMQEIAREDEGAKGHGHGSNGSNNCDNSRSRITHNSKFAYRGIANGGRSGGSRGNANGGQAGGSRENGNNGGSRSPYTQGSTFIPVYAAGAANNRHHNNRHSAANSNRKCIGLPILFASTWASLVHLYMAFRY